MPIHTPLRKNCRVLSYFALWYALNVAYNITNKWALEEVRHKVQAQAAKEHDFEISHLSSALPLTIGCIQFGIGALYACTLWVLRLRPLPHADELSRGIAVLIRYTKQLGHGIVRMLRPMQSQQTESFRWSVLTSPREHNNVASSIVLRDTSKIGVHHTFGQLCTIMSLSTNSISFAHVIKAMEPFFSAIASWLVLGQMMDIRVYASLLPVVGGVIMACAGSPEFCEFL